MMKQVNCWILFLAAALLLLFNCKREEADTQIQEKLKGLEFSKDEFSMEVGESVNLSRYLTVLPESLAESVQLQWSVDDDEVAEVSETGRVRAMEVGFATVTVRSADRSAECDITVKKAQPRIVLTASPVEGGEVLGAGQYKEGEMVTVKAVPSSGWLFQKWSDGNTEVVRDVKCSGRVSLMAYFVEEHPAVTTAEIVLTAYPEIGGEVSGGGVCSIGNSVVLEAKPSKGYEFKQWSDGCTDAKRTVEVVGDLSLIALFAKEGGELETPIVDGKLPGMFSVSSTKKVRFSKGNLQYQASSRTWRFAENQYDVIGENNENISSYYSGWIDLFGWGTSGYNGKYPYMTSADSEDYGTGYKDIAGTNYDWGVYNAISNGGNKAGMWRTLTYDEWFYLLSSRTNHQDLRGKAIVNGKAGYILLPDEWIAPSGLTFIANPDTYSTNSYSASEWSKMEAAGAVFLPSAGYRSGTGFYTAVGINGYWSPMALENGVFDGYAYCFSLFHESMMWEPYYTGHSVRLATE